MQKIPDERIFHYFSEISRIPRNSGEEKEASNWIKAQAEAMGLEVVQDSFFNLMIKKPAAAGYESSEPVMLQAHIDMVCEKNSDSNHDFNKDPIRLRIDEDWISSDCGTSLGADNGIGVAAAMAVLEDNTLKHPPLEVAFTVEEESTFAGAENFSPDMFSSKRMINLDHAVDDEIIAASCGGMGTVFTLPVEWEEEIPQNLTAYRVTLTGLKGGHSGEDIHRGRGNAIRLLMNLIADEKIKIVSFRGGTYRLAIAREAEAVVLTEDGGYLEDKARSTEEQLKRTMGEAAADLKIIVEKTEAAHALEADSEKRLMEAVMLFPDGIVSMNSKFNGIVDNSNNLGTVFTEKDMVKITSETRGMSNIGIEDILDRIRCLAGATGAECEFFGAYAPWEYNPDSKLRECAIKTYETMFGESMKELIIHAGLECGIFVKKKPGMDAIAIGPDCQFFHSPNEKVCISSTKKFYSFLVKLLEELK